MKREEKLREMYHWAIGDLDNDNNELEKYYELIDAMDDETLDDEYDATVGEWKRSLDDGNEGCW